MNADVTVETVENAIGKMLSIPGVVGFPQALLELVDESLSDQGHSHLTVSNMKVHGAGTVPSERLIGLEELFQVPSFGIFVGKGIGFVTVTSSQKRLEDVVIRFFSGPLNQLPVGTGRSTVQAVGNACGGKAGPSSGEALFGQGLHLFADAFSVGHGHKEIKGGLAVHVVD